MPTVRRSRLVHAPPDAVWELIADPWHLPRWWPRVSRVEGVGAKHWTKVLGTKKGRGVRADERLLESDRPRRRVWTQELPNTPFERLLWELRTEVDIEPAEGGSLVSIQQKSKLRGLNRFGGGFLVRRATKRLLDDALEGLEQACGR